MRFIHTADIHLDSPLAGLRARAGARGEELAGATRTAFTRLVDYAVDQEVELVLISGDLYDGDWRDFSTGLFFAGCMGRLGRAGIRVGLIMGNHDADNVMTRRLSLPPNVHLFPSHKADSWVLEDLGLAIHGRSFPSRAVTENFVTGYPAPRAGLLNIGMLHTAADGQYGHDPYAPCTIADMAAKGYDYWALGHIHKRMVLAQDPWIVFPGNIQGRHANETGDKGFTLVTAEGGRIRTVEHVPIDVVRWDQLTPDLTGCPDADAAWGRVRAAIEGAVQAADGRTLALRLRLTGTTAAHRALAGDPDRTTAEVEALAAQTGADIWIEQVRVETADALPPIALAGDALGDLLRTIGEIAGDPAERATLRDLLAKGVDKMPPAAREAADLADLDGPALDRLLAEAQGLLMDRLLAEDTR